MNIAAPFRHLARLRGIVSVFARHGFSEVFARIGLGQLVAAADGEAAVSTPVPTRLRMAFEELGTTFVKLGQLLSLRVDMLPPEYVAEFRKLQDQATQLPYDAVRGAIEAELGAKLDKLYARVDGEPLGAASIAQVHRATTLGGEEVVIKVQRPGIEQEIEADMGILLTLAGLLERAFEEARTMNLVGVAREFAKHMREELDFTHEAGNLRHFTRDFEGEPTIVIPRVHAELSNKRILTMDFLAGVKMRDAAAVREMGLDPGKVTALSGRLFFRMAFENGFFHGDVHGGNLILMAPTEAAPDGRVGLIDCGMVGVMGRSLIEDVASLFVDLFQRDYQALARDYLRIAEAPEGVDLYGFARDLERILDPIMSRPLKEIRMGPLVGDLAECALRRRIRLPEDLLLFFKSIIAIEGLGRNIDPEFDIAPFAQEYAKRLVLERLSPERMAVDASRLARDVVQLSRSLPARLDRIAESFERGRTIFHLSLRDKEEMGEWWDRMSARLASALAGGLLQVAAGILALDGGHTVLATLMGGAGMVFLAPLAWSLLKNGRF